LGDTFLTPYSTAGNGFRRTYGAELHATALAMLLEGRFIRPVSGWAFAALALAYLLAIAGASFALPMRWGLAAALVMLPVWLIGAVGAFLAYGLLLPFLVPVVFGVAVLLGSQIVLRVAEARRTRAIRETFGRYVAPEVVAELIDRHHDMAFSGEARQVTILFSDLEGFTSLSERTPPAEVLRLLNEYLEGMISALFEQRGTIGDFVGDAIMAYFGAPIATGDHAARACRGALAMQDRLRELNTAWEKRRMPPLRMRIGIHSGETIAGSVGSARRAKYTLIGDAVNLASRLEGVNKFFGTSALLSTAARELAGGAFLTRELGRVIVQGRHEPVSVYELLGERNGDRSTEPRATEKTGIYQEGLRSFRAADFSRALDAFRAGAAQYGDGAARFMAEQCLHLRDRNLPKDWDGSIELPSK
jgi:adenylate cyclase